MRRCVGLMFCLVQVRLCGLVVGCVTVDVYCTTLRFWYPAEFRVRVRAVLDAFGMLMIVLGQEVAPLQVFFPFFSRGMTLARNFASMRHVQINLRDHLALCFKYPPLHRKKQLMAIASLCHQPLFLFVLANQTQQHQTQEQITTRNWWVKNKFGKKPNELGHSHNKHEFDPATFKTGYAITHTQWCFEFSSNRT